MKLNLVGLNVEKTSESFPIKIEIMKSKNFESVMDKVM